VGFLSCAGTSVEFDDRTLLHLQIVIVARFRRGQSVLLSWMDSRSTGGGRTSIWLTPSQPVEFHFRESRAADVDQDWLGELLASADTGTGLVVVDSEGRLIHGRARRS
jgi:hypothetical protein